MKVIVQIPCFNEANTLPLVFEQMPKTIPGVDVLEFQIIDDGSTDNTVEVARQLGVHHVVTVSKTNRRWLGRAFRIGIDHALKQGADIVVNTDGDNQYPSEFIPQLIRPIVEQKVDIVIGDRDPGANREFSTVKRLLQRLGSSTVAFFTGADIPDAVSGFRAYSREALLRLHVITNYTYTVDTLIQATKKGLDIAWVPIPTNSKTRDSRLITSLATKVRKSGGTILRLATVYEPFKLFAILSLVFFTPAILLMFRFALLFILGDGAGHIQSLVFAGAMLVIGSLMIVLGVLADLLAVNRSLIEDLLTRIRRLESEQTENRPVRDIYERLRVNE